LTYHKAFARFAAFRESLVLCSNSA